MPTQLTQDDFVRALTIGRRGQFYAKLSPGEWIGLINANGHPVMFQGGFREVIETFVPFNGTIRHVSGIMDGVIWDGETVRRVPMDEYMHSKRRKGVKQNEIRKGGAA